MKKIIALTLVLVMMLSMLAGCGKAEPAAPEAAATEVTTQQAAPEKQEEAPAAEAVSDPNETE